MHPLSCFVPAVIAGTLTRGSPSHAAHDWPRNGLSEEGIYYGVKVLASCAIDCSQGSLEIHRPTTERHLSDGESKLAFPRFDWRNCSNADFESKAMLGAKTRVYSAASLSCGRFDSFAGYRSIRSQILSLLIDLRFGLGVSGLTETLDKRVKAPSDSKSKDALCCFFDLKGPGDPDIQCDQSLMAPTTPVACQIGRPCRCCKDFTVRERRTKPRGCVLFDAQSRLRLIAITRRQRRRDAFEGYRCDLVDQRCVATWLARGWHVVASAREEGLRQCQHH